MYRKLLLQPHDEVGATHEFNKTLQREIHLARNIQMKLLNGEKPELSSGEVSGVSIPARLIGGDYFDFYPLSNGKIRIIIGDVMGKGIPAAMLMILTRGAFRSAAEATKGPGQTLTAMNNAMFRDLRKLGSFVTVFCADWDPATGVFIYANAGHSLPVFVRANIGIVEPPDLKGVMLGGLTGQLYKEEQTQLKEDDLVFFYTDGIVEAINHDGEMFQLDRLIQILVKHGHKEASKIEETVINQISTFTEGLPQKDDITMVILKVGDDKTEIINFNAPALNP
ncbi:PP2C family protein-serine/threonine phosphatase [Paenibacillus agricola]|uniref:Serine/threonine-protein phosphatase n=1 Tax=Paenibacillus agricola TaxID=2716264 RepID=A0ABX0JFT4_9BACL|nr:PP2C family protein-serine/threonine phosphatase [Paenibacillus agricola]NHN35422.1 serine/threonine-protein phosphatase [Paenibacillus agricola]